MSSALAILAGATLALLYHLLRRGRRALLRGGPNLSLADSAT